MTHKKLHFGSKVRESVRKTALKRTKFALREIAEISTDNEEACFRGEYVKRTVNYLQTLYKLRTNARKYVNRTVNSWVLLYKLRTADFRHSRAHAYVML